MTPTRGISWIERVLFFALRIVLWPIASARPDSSWARMHRRLGALGDDGAPQGEHAPTPPRTQPDRPPLVPMGVFCALVLAAAALWIWDVVRDPPPAPAPGHCARLVDPR